VTISVLWSCLGARKLILYNLRRLEEGSMASGTDHSDPEHRKSVAGGISDEEAARLWQTFLTGDNPQGLAAFDQLYVGFLPVVVRYCRFHLRDIHLAEDVAHAVFVRLLEIPGSQARRREDAADSCLHEAPAAAHAAVLVWRIGPLPLRRISRQDSFSFANVGSRGAPEGPPDGFPLATPPVGDIL